MRVLKTGKIGLWRHLKRFPLIARSIPYHFGAVPDLGGLRYSTGLRKVQVRADDRSSSCWRCHKLQIFKFTFIKHLNLSETLFSPAEVDLGVQATGPSVIGRSCEVVDDPGSSTTTTSHVTTATDATREICLAPMMTMPAPCAR